MTGFREGAYAKVWDIKPVEGKNATDIRITISSKNKETGEYKDDFAGYVRLYGKAQEKAGTIEKKDRIKLIETCVSYSFNPESRKTFYYFTVFDFDKAAPYTNSGNNTGTDYPFVTEGDNPVEQASTSDLPY